MKIRQGFISNSSSSSFIIAYKENLEISDETVSEMFKIETISSMFDLSKKIIKFLNNKSNEIEDFDEWIEDQYGSDYKKEALEFDFVKKIKNLFDRNFIVKTGWLYSDTGNILEEFLSEAYYIKCDEENLFIEIQE